MAGFDARDSTSLERPAEDYARDLEKPLAGLRIGLPREFFGPGMDADVRAAEIEPFRDAFASLFFVSIGMLFDWNAIAGAPWTVGSCLLAVVVGKAVVVMLAAEKLAVAPIPGCVPVGEFRPNSALAAHGGPNPLVERRQVQHFLGSQ